MNTASPVMKIVLRPIRSPIRPASSNRPPNAIRYAFITQARLDCEKPRSSWIAGSATFTTVASRMIMSIPTQRTTSAIQRLGSASAGASRSTAPVSVIAVP